MARANRIPEKDVDFNNYINKTTKWLLSGNTPVWQRLGFPESIKNKWLSMQQLWNAYYKKCRNNNERTPLVVKQKNDIRKKFIPIANHQLNRITAHPELTTEDRLIFHLRKWKRTYTHRGEIDSMIVADIIPERGATVKIRLLGVKQSGRPVRHPLADVADMRYEVLPVGATPPEFPENCSKQFYSSKALFRLKLGPSASGKKLYIFFRWLNMSNQAHSGPWCMRCETVLL